jgi:hypothetical protein
MVATRIVALLAVPVLLFAAVVRAINVSRDRVLPGLAQAAEPDFRTGSPQALVSVDDGFVASVVGAPVYARVVGSGPRSAPSPSQPPARSKPADAAPPAPAGPSVRPGRTTPLFAPGSWDLRLAMAPDRTSVHTGDVFSYTITVRNVGRDRFAGSLRLDWHVPLHTRAVTQCTVAAICDLLGPIFLDPGLGVDGTLGIHFNSLQTTAVIPPGDAFTHTFQVQVNAVVPPGTELNDHAHLGVGGGGTGRVTANAAPVSVEQQPL